MDSRQLKMTDDRLRKLSTTQRKETTQNTAEQNYPGSVDFYHTRPGNEVGLFYSSRAHTTELIPLNTGGDNKSWWINLLWKWFKWCSDRITQSHNLQWPKVITATGKCCISRGTLTMSIVTLITMIVSYVCTASNAFAALSLNVVYGHLALIILTYRHVWMEWR